MAVNVSGDPPTSPCGLPDARRLSNRIASYRRSLWFMPVPGLQSHRDRLQLDRLGRAHFFAFAAGGTRLAEHDMYLLRRAHDGVGGTDLEAARTADADLLLHLGHHRPLL